jgi:hypothetical protein
MSRFIASLIPRLMLLSFLAVLACAASAMADSINWNFNATLADNGSVSGSFVYDTGSQTVTDWIITATFGDPSSLTLSDTYTMPYPAQPSYTFSPINSQFTQVTAWPGAPTTNLKFMTPNPPGNLTYPQYLLYINYPATFPLGSPGTCTVGPTTNTGLFEATEYVSSPSIFPVYYTSYFTKLEMSSVPLPPSVLLLGSGLIPLVWARRRKRLGR